ncbi:MAG: hypothetical protein JWO67_6451 [Streptosporangiaceae bacterium]|nr:hypothetical protein [Streptosporangiaceae bacterium]
MPTALSPEGRRVTCRYLRRSGDQCTAEVAEPDGEILLCTKHISLTLELVNHLAGGSVTATLGKPA